jgi:hypothetical protein
MRPFIKVKGLVLLAALSFTSCWIQGPWDYSPSNEAPFQGLDVNAYLIADRPVTDICIERMHTLEEEYTPAFAWYSTAQVEIQGKWSDGTTRALTLSPNPEKPSCFRAGMADMALYPVRGEQYQFAAKMAWDSAGTTVTTALSATTRVPKEFTIVKDSGASANIAAYPLGESIGDDPLAFFNTLDTIGQNKFLDRWGDQLEAVASDSAKLEKFIADSGQAVLAYAQDLLQEHGKKFKYSSGDTVYYLTGTLNNLSHSYKSIYDSSTIGIVLVSHKIDTTSFIPENSFSEITKRFTGGVVPPSSLAFRGDTRRVLSYPNQFLRGVNVINPLQVLNTYFFGGLNKLYFTAFDSNYRRYVETYIDDGQDPRVKKRFNIQGGWGFFTGGVTDSFELVVKLPPTIPGQTPLQFYSNFETRAHRCSEAGWSKDENCRRFRLTYCETIGFDEEKYRAANSETFGNYKGYEKYSTCGSEIAYKAFMEGQASGTWAQSQSLTAPSAQEDTLGMAWACLQKGMSQNECKFLESKFTAKTLNPVINWSYDWCKDRNWRDSAGSCSQILVSYVRVGQSKSPVLKQQADQFCRQNSNNAFCL